MGILYHADSVLGIPCGETALTHCVVDGGNVEVEYPEPIEGHAATP